MKRRILTFAVQIALLFSAQSSFASQGVYCGEIFYGFGIKLNSTGSPVSGDAVMGYTTYDLDYCISPKPGFFACKPSKPIDPRKMAEFIQVSTRVEGSQMKGTLVYALRGDKVRRQVAIDKCRFY